MYTVSQVIWESFILDMFEVDSTFTKDLRTNFHFQNDKTIE